MFGANYLGQPQYGQGPAIYVPPVTHSISATVTATATLSTSIITNQLLSVTVTCTAVIVKQFRRNITATITSTATFANQITRTLKLLRPYTKFLNPDRYTLTAIIPDSDAYFQADYFQNNYFQIGIFSALGGTATITKSLDPPRTTKRIEE